jgi:uncharacterized membrane protein
MGLALALIVFLLSGIMMRTPPFRRLFGGTETFLLSIPVVKSIYGALRDFSSLFVRRKGEEALQVVEIEMMPGSNVRLLGFVTRTEFKDLPAGIGGEDDVAVYLPMSYQVGGYTVYVPRERVKHIDMSREDAMRFVLLAGLRSKTPIKRAVPKSG